MSALRRHVLANSFKTSNAVVVAWPHLLVALASRNHPIALLMPQRGRRMRAELNRVKADLKDELDKVNADAEKLRALNVSHP